VEWAFLPGLVCGWVSLVIRKGREREEDHTVALFSPRSCLKAYLIFFGLLAVVAVASKLIYY